MRKKKIKAMKPTGKRYGSILEMLEDISDPEFVESFVEFRDHMAMVHLEECKMSLMPADGLWRARCQTALGLTSVFAKKSADAIKKLAVQVELAKQTKRAPRKKGGRT